MRKGRRNRDYKDLLRRFELLKRENENLEGLIEELMQRLEVRDKPSIMVV